MTARRVPGPHRRDVEPSTDRTSLFLAGLVACCLVAAHMVRLSARRAEQVIDRRSTALVSYDRLSVITSRSRETSLTEAGAQAARQLDLTALQAQWQRCRPVAGLRPEIVEVAGSPSLVLRSVSVGDQ